MRNRHLVIAVIIVSLILAAAIVFGGCGKNPGLMDPPPKNTPPVANRLVDDRPSDLQIQMVKVVSRGQLSASKPTVNGNKENSAVVKFQILDESESPFNGFYSGNPYNDNLEVVHTVSGRLDWDQSIGVGLSGNTGEFVMRFYNSKPINGYYRIRLKRYLGGTNYVDILGEWSSIPINNGQTVDLILQVGRQAMFIRDEIKKTVTKKKAHMPWRG